MQIIYQDINNIKPYKNNPRFNKESAKLVAESIKQFGFKVPIIVDNKNEIIAGHTRLEASKLLGIKKIPTIIANDLNEEKIKAFRLADNKVSEFAIWDKEKLEEEINKIKDINLELLGFINEEAQVDWDSVEEISDENYEEPEHEKMECPYCHHIDRKIHFKKTKILDMSDII